MQHINLKDIKSVHFVGIGGSSMSGLAYFMLCKNKAISGSDREMNPSIQELISQGVKINIPHKAQAVETLLPELVVYTVAVSQDNSELVAAKRLGIPIIDRADFLGLIMDEYRFSMCVAGTHGKTTTTSMLASIIYENDLDPAIHIGGVLPLIGGNTRVGFGNYFITEACEYFDSFLKFKPDIGIILNVEHDHVDYFKSFEDMKDSFRRFVELIPKEGYVIVSADDPDALEVTQTAKCNVITFGIDNLSAKWTAREIIYKEVTSFGLYHKDEKLFNITLGTSGKHNILNALAAIAAAESAGIPPQDCVEPLKTFTGANRRYEIKGSFNGIKVVDDYAHHPTEIKATLQAAASSHNSGQIWVVFQPHTYTRTRKLIDQFASSFIHADHVVLADIYASREADPGDIHSKQVAEKINKFFNNCIYLGSFDKITSYVKKHAKPGDLVICMGAGDITNVANMLLE